MGAVSSGFPLFADVCPSLPDVRSYLNLPYSLTHCDIGRVKSGNFGHQVNSDIHLQTVDIQMRRLLMSRLIRIFTACLVNLFFIPIIEV